MSHGLQCISCTLAVVAIVVVLVVTLPYPPFLPMYSDLTFYDTAYLHVHNYTFIISSLP